MTILHRTAEVRSTPTGRTVFGRVVPYNVETEIHEFGSAYTEKFAPGAFTRSLTERGDKVRLFVQHDTARRLPIGKATELRERSDGLHAAFAVAETRDGDEALTLVREGVVDAFSIGFKPIRDRQERNTTVRVEASLREVSLVAFPAYEGAQVAGVRSMPVLDVDTAKRRLQLKILEW